MKIPVWVVCLTAILIGSLIVFIIIDRTTNSNRRTLSTSIANDEDADRKAILILVGRDDPNTLSAEVSIEGKEAQCIARYRNTDRSFPDQLGMTTIIRFKLRKYDQKWRIEDSEFNIVADTPEGKAKAAENQRKDDERQRQFEMQMDAARLEQQATNKRIDEMYRRATSRD